jgi:hypothetical protein
MQIESMETNYLDETKDAVYTFIFRAILSKGLITMQASK